MKKGRRKRSVKNIVLKAITLVAFTLGICLCCGVEPQTDAQMLFVCVALAGCWGWVALFCYVNGLM